MVGSKTRKEYTVLVSHEAVFREKWRGCIVKATHCFGFEDCTVVLVPGIDQS